MFETLVEDLSIHARDTFYAVYALECTPHWDLPKFNDPQLDGARYEQDSFPLTDIPQSIVAKSNYQNCKVYDADDPREDQKIPSWKFLADAASTVYYVGHADDLQSRLAQHRKGIAADFTGEVTIESNHIFEHHPQNLRNDLLDAIGAAIVTLQQNSKETFRQKIADLRRLQESVEDRTNVSYVEVRRVGDEVYSNEYPAEIFEEINRVCNNAWAERVKNEKKLAKELRNPSAPLPFTRRPSPDERISIDDIETFAYWG